MSESKIAVVMGKDIKPSYGDPRPGDVRDSQADSTKARSRLGWCPEFTLEEGLKKTIDYFLNEE